MEIMRWHAPDDGLGRNGRDQRHRERLLGLLRRVQLPEPDASA
jgi:hypothetical protein